MATLDLTGGRWYDGPARRARLTGAFCDPRRYHSQKDLRRERWHGAAQSGAAGTPRGRYVGDQIRYLTGFRSHAPGRSTSLASGFFVALVNQTERMRGQQEERDGYQSRLRYRPAARGRGNRGGNC